MDLVELLKWMLCCAKLVEWAACIPIRGWVSLSAGTGTCKWCSCLFAGEGAKGIGYFCIIGWEEHKQWSLHVWMAMDRENLYIYRVQWLRHCCVGNTDMGYMMLYKYMVMLMDITNGLSQTIIAKWVKLEGTWNRVTYHISQQLGAQILFEAGISCAKIYAKLGKLKQAQVLL